MTLAPDETTARYLIAADIADQLLPDATSAERCLLAGRILALTDDPPLILRALRDHRAGTGVVPR